MNIKNQLRPVFRHCRSADPAPDRDLYAGRFALKGTKDQNAIFHPIKSGPVEIVQRVIEKGRRVSKTRDFVRHPMDQCRKLLVQRLIICHDDRSFLLYRLFDRLDELFDQLIDQLWFIVIRIVSRIF